MNRLSNEKGFTITELLVSSALTMIVIAGALTTFKQGLEINDSAAQLADANQNLRAGTNQLIRDLMQACRIIGAQGIDMPAGGVTAFVRPGPVAGQTFNLVVDDANTLNLPCLTTGFQLGPSINGSATDMVTIMTVDEFMPVLTTPATPATGTAAQNVMALDGSSVTLPATSLWLLGDPTNGTPAIQVGDLVLFKGPSGTAIQTITSTDATHIFFALTDYFKFNQRGATTVPVKLLAAGPGMVSMFRAMMITYYVDNTTTPGTPRLTRLINNFAPQALAGVVEDMDLTYDLVDGVSNPAAVTSLPYTATVNGIVTTYNSNQIRKVNIHVGVRSETLSNPVRDYIRNHMSTSVDVRSLASVDKYPSS